MHLQGYIFTNTLLYVFWINFSVSEVLEQERVARAESRVATCRAIPCCSVCKNPMKGHKNIRDSPKNQQAVATA